MNMPIRHYRLSARKGEGIWCGAEGAFVGDAPLLKRSDGRWDARDNDELSEHLSETYGLPVDFIGKSAGLSAIARALNDGDIARAQLIGLHLRLPEPLPLTKNAPSQNEIGELAGLLEYAGVLKHNDRHYPAGTPDHKGGQFAPKDSGAASTSGSDQKDGDDPTDNLGPLDDPRQAARRLSGSENQAADENAASAETDAVGVAEERAARGAEVRAAVRAVAMSTEAEALRKATRRLFREAALEALQRIGSKLVLSEIPIVGLVADLATVYDVYKFVREFAKLRAEIRAATRFVNAGAHTLEQLRVSSESLSFSNYDAFLKLWDAVVAQIELEKRFGSAGEGFQYHHIIEQESGEAENITESTDNIIKIPAILHDEISARYARNQAQFGGLSLRKWLLTQPTNVKRQWGIRILREVGIIVGD